MQFHNNKDKVLIIDFGSQVTKLIARRVRELGVYSEIITPKNIIKLKDYKNIKGLILSGGPSTVTKKKFQSIPKEILEKKIPILGICYGMQTMAIQLGGNAKYANKSEFGFAQIHKKNNSQLLDDIYDDIKSNGDELMDVWMSHGVEVTKLPKGFELIASTDNCPIAGFANKKKKYYGLQFHPEVTHTKQGINILERFV